MERVCLDPHQNAVALAEHVVAEVGRDGALALSHEFASEVPGTSGDVEDGAVALSLIHI